MPMALMSVDIRPMDPLFGPDDFEVLALLGRSVR